MPVSHDAKPRNKWRREKAKAVGHAIIVTSGRTRQRRRLRRDAMEARSLEVHIAAVLKFEGKAWRYFERASKHESERIVALAGARRASYASSGMMAA